MNEASEGTTPQGENFDFEFNEWLFNKGLMSLKHLFIKHGATSSAALQVSSSAMQNLMADREFLSQPQMVPKVVMAIHELAVPVEKTVVVEKTTVVDRIVAVVLSQQEQAVIEGITERMQSVQQMEEKVNRLQSEYTSKQQRIEDRKTDRMTAISAQITETFDTLLAALTERAQTLLDQLHRMKLQSVQNNDDKNHSDKVTVCRKNIDDLKQFLKEKENAYNVLMSVEKDSAQRRRQILQIGLDVTNRFTAQHRCIAKLTESLRKRFDEEIESDCDTKFITTKQTYDRIIADIGRLGTLAPRRSPSQQSENTTDSVSRSRTLRDLKIATCKISMKLTFSHRPVRSWRYDTEQNKWRGRGKGVVRVYWNKRMNLWKLIFVDERHQKVRLDQWINGAGRCEYALDLTPSENKNGAPKLNQTELEWFGADYATYWTTPLVGKWKLDFIENVDAASHFMKVFNDHTALPHAVTENKFEDTDINELNDVKQHVVERKEEIELYPSIWKPVDNSPLAPELLDKFHTLYRGYFHRLYHKYAPDKVQKVDMIMKKYGNTLAQLQATYVRATQKYQVKEQDIERKVTVNEIKTMDITEDGRIVENQEAPQTPPQVSNGKYCGFGVPSSGFSFGTMNDMKTDKPPLNGDTSADTNTNNADNNKDEDNMTECTFKPIVQLEEQHLVTGHENETLIAKYHYTKLYRFGPDVSGDMGWKNRGSQSEVSFYKNNSTGAVRMISRNHIMQLRMNQMVYPEDKASFTKKTPKMYSWTAFDVTIAKEEGDVNKGQSAWLIKFRTEELAMEFAGHFRLAMKMNMSVERTLHAGSNDDEYGTIDVKMDGLSASFDYMKFKSENEQNAV